MQPRNIQKSYSTRWALFPDNCSPNDLGYSAFGELPPPEFCFSPSGIVLWFRDARLGPSSPKRLRLGLEPSKICHFLLISLCFLVLIKTKSIHSVFLCLIWKSIVYQIISNNLHNVRESWQVGIANLIFYKALIKLLPNLPKNSALCDRPWNWQKLRVNQKITAPGPIFFCTAPCRAWVISGVLCVLGPAWMGLRKAEDNSFIHLLSAYYVPSFVSGYTDVEI